MDSMPCPIVAMGASAGGLEALQAFLSAVPPAMDAAFVVIQHLEPSHESRAAEILGRSTTMPAMQITNGMTVEPNQVYVIPPNRYLTVAPDGTFALVDPVLVRGVRMPIDAFFRSLAQLQDVPVAAVILSGTGADGATGLRSVKEGGGLVLVQAPETARYPDMPRNAIATGVTDLVCAVEAMPEQLAEFFNHPFVRTVPSGEPASDAGDEARQLEALIRLMQMRTGHDLSMYKIGTVRRRIARRMVLLRASTLSDYLQMLREPGDEATRLLNDMLIGVTSFFRDSTQFEALTAEAIAPLVERKHAEESIRVWVPGCATGEEVYSIAMVLLERLEAAGKTCFIRIFATDIDEAARS
jgi:two-component system CheB/CheR fusion protein